jgi:hypothetical protein
MLENVFAPQTLLGPLKKFGTTKPDTYIGLKEGWFYPLFTTRSEAIQEDIDRGGRGVYRVLSFYETEGEFYIPDNYQNIAMNRDPLVYTLYAGAGAENPFKKIQNRLSILIPNQLPEFVQEEYDMFVTFIKAYYEFLEQDYQAQEVLQDITKYADIDTTSEEMIERFMQNYANDLSKSNIANNRFLVKKIREIYSKKGTEPSYRMLFNILYKESIDFFYPYDIVLKTSDGKWDVPEALRVRQLSIRQNIFDFENTLITGSVSGASAVVGRVIQLDLSGNDVYELSLEPGSILGEFSNDEIVYATKISTLSNGERVTSQINARTYSILSRIKIADGGLGYAKDTPLTITDSTGILARAKIKDVNRYGAITNIDVIESGLNYSANTVIDPGYPTVPRFGTYVVKRGQITVTFPLQHGIVKGKNISVYYTGNVFSPIDNTSHTATVTAIPDARSIRYKYPGF